MMALGKGATMRTAKQRLGAVALSAFDLPDSGQLLVHGCEDCACAVSGTHAGHGVGTLPSPSGRLIRGRDVQEFQVDGEHWGVFNPAGEGGVVVLNALARQVLRCFGDPATLADARAAVPQAAGERSTRKR